MIHTFEEARRRRRHQQASLCPSLPVSCSTTRLAITLTSLLCLIVAIIAMAVVAPAVGNSKCPSDSGDWLPGFDPFGAAMAVCVTVFIMSLLGLWTIYSTSVNTLIAFAAVLLPCFSCVMSCSGMLLTYPGDSTALFEEYAICSPTPRLQNSCAYAATRPRSFGTLLLFLALLFAWAFVEVSRVIGFLAFLIRYMKVVNAFTGALGVGVLGVGILLLGSAGGAEPQDPEQAALVPDWAPGLIVFAGLVMLLLSLLALVGLARKKDNVLYAHAGLSVAVCVVIIAGAARQSSHVDEITYLAAAHRLSVACAALLMILLLLLNVCGSIHMILELRKQGITFVELVSTADYTMNYKLHNALGGSALPSVHNPLDLIRRGHAHPQHEVKAPPLSLELEDSTERYHATLDAKEFFGPRGGR